MGGRGASSRIGQSSLRSPQALVITTDNGTRLEFRKQKNGFITDMVGTDVINMNGKTFSDLKKIAQKNGYQVKEYTSKDLEQWDKNRKAEREVTNKILDANDGAIRPDRNMMKYFKTSKPRKNRW